MTQRETDMEKKDRDREKERPGLPRTVVERAELLVEQAVVAVQRVLVPAWPAR